MRILVVGAGSIGGYFGGRLIEAGADVTFLVRPRRAEILARTGLKIRSPLGDFHEPAPKLVTADRLETPFDLILLSCKAYDLDDAIASFAPAVGPATAILPLLNGMRHLDALDAPFGAGSTLGGQCVISAVLDAEGHILHLNEANTLTFGERGGGRSPRADAIAALFATASFTTVASEAILQDMWEKWVFIATVAGITCLMRAAIGDIVSAGGADLASGLLDECAVIAARSGFPPRQAFLDRTRKTLTAPNSPLTASMLRDIERGAQTEADHIVGDLLHRADAQTGERTALLTIALAHLNSYESRRTREAHGPPNVPGIQAA